MVSFRRFLPLVVLVLVLAGCGMPGQTLNRRPAPSPTSTVTQTVHPDPDGTTAPAVPRITWEPCGDGVECGRVEVPLDHHHPDGDRISIALTRRRAEDPTQRRGVLLVNPGGPGESGTQLVYLEPDRFTPTVRRHFDLVGYDPRGVGASSAVRCPATPTHTEVIPEDAAEFDELVATNREFAARCAERTGDLLYHVDTRSVARDLELLRLALGEERLNLYGSSYGTLFALTYAELYPDRVRTLVLDGVVDPSAPLDVAVLREAEALERVFDSFASWCALEPECALHGRDVHAAWDELVARARQSPLPAGNVQVDDEILLGTLYQLMYSSGNWPAAAASIQMAVDGDPGAFGPPAEGDPDTSTVEITPIVRPLPDPEYNSDGLHAAMACADRPPPFTERERIEELARRAAERAPRFGPYVVWSQFRPCLGWPAPRAEQSLDEVRVSGLPPALLLGSTGDVATPLEGTRAVAGQLPGSTLVVLDTDVHGVYGGISPCVDQTVERYLLDVVPPTDGEAVCTLS